MPPTMQYEIWEEGSDETPLIIEADSMEDAIREARRWIEGRKIISARLICRMVIRAPRAAEALTQ